MATQTVTTAGEIPKALEPFYVGTGTPGTPEYKQGLIERGIGEIFKKYEDRYAPVIKAGLMGKGAVAGLTPAQQELGQRLQALQVPDQFGTAAQFGQQAGAGLAGLMGVQAQGVTAPQLQQFQMGPAQQVAGGQYDAPLMQAAQMGLPSQFTSEALQQYMSPYMQGVVDVQQRKAVEAAQRAQLGQNLGAARQGTYGGARQALLQGQREAGLRQELGDIQSRGLQEAFTQAQSQFERDRAATMQAQLANLNTAQQAAVQNQATQLQAQGLTAQQAMQAALANQQAGLTVGQQNLAAQLGVQQLGATQSLEAQRANQAAELQAAQQRLAAAQGLGGLAQTMGGLGIQELAGQMDILKAQGAFGDLERAIAQQQLDAERQALMQRSQYGMTQVGDLSNLLRGIPLSDTTQTQTTPPPSFASQLTGMGLTGIGLYNLLGGGK